MNDVFISKDDPRTFEGFLKYQAIDPAMLTQDELAMYRGYFEESVRRRKNGPKVGLMNLPSRSGEQKYAVAARSDGAAREEPASLVARR
jgi:hypothetical protein